MSTRNCNRWTYLYAAIVVLAPAALAVQAAGSRPPASVPAITESKTKYVDAVTRGEGFLTWQQRGVSEAEQVFRQGIEDRKTQMIGARSAGVHPVLLTPADIEQAKHNIASADWAGKWYKSRKELADYVVGAGNDYIAQMIPELTPTNPYGLTCPNCVGRKSQEAIHRGLMDWDWRKPDQLVCNRCGQVYPSEQYPETARLVCPRSAQTFTYYLNEQERQHPDDRTGKYAWHWVGRPIHVSFTGIIRGQKIAHMIDTAESCALVYQITGEPGYAQAAIRILTRLAHCYRKWLYHDYWDTVADCDPMYAAWHDKNLPLEFKRHLCADAYKKDTFERAAMLRDFWGAGRIHPSTDGIGHLAALARAYDLVANALDEHGRSAWTEADRSLVERDLLLEYVMGAEPYVGGADAATTANNKVPAIYQAMAAVARSVGLPKMADTALRGYEAVRDECFRFDGFSRETPAYNNMYLASLVLVPETLLGFNWPADFTARRGTVDLYRNDPKLGLMFRAMFDSLRPDGRWAPLSDSMIDGSPNAVLAEIGLNRYPEYFEGRLPALYRGKSPTEYAIFHLKPEQMAIDRGLRLPELYFPAWMTAFLRHGDGPESSMLAMPFCPPGPHRHSDNLALFYADRGRCVLGDHGYVGDMPLNEWIHHTFSHNLVIVDGAEQRSKDRTPRFGRMVCSPQVSLVEASSDAYASCREYRRLVALFKGPGAETFAVDIFRVKGGHRHAYRLFSDLASSEVKEGSLTLAGLSMPPESPLPQVGASLKHEDIFGLRDVRGVDKPPPTWQATWTEPDNQFRVWMLAPADRVEASNGPGQQTREQIGRRVRYLDVIREGADLASTFVAVHEPSGPGNMMPIRKVERLNVPDEAGPDAVAVRIESAWGTYLVLSEFAKPVEVAGARFEGPFGVLCQTPQNKRWLLACGARTLKAGDLGFENATPVWTGKVVKQSEQDFTTDTPRPADWPAATELVKSYVAVQTKDYRTGLPVSRTSDRAITVERFPLPEVGDFSLEHVRFAER